jgi:hypothetical protein
LIGLIPGIHLTGKVHCKAVSQMVCHIGNLFIDFGFVRIFQLILMIENQIGRNR